MVRSPRFIALVVGLAASVTRIGWSQSQPEQVRWSRHESGVRICVVAPAQMATRPRTLILFATPNGNTIEQSLGCAAAAGVDWHFDIQHVAAQIRRLRELETTRDIVLAVVQAPKLSWPAFRREQAQAAAIIREIVTNLVTEVSADRVVLSGHSGGGSFLFGYLNAVESLPANLERMVFLDANYAYSDEEHHGEKLLAWLQGDPARHLVVIAYDDREITLNGKKVVGPESGTFRASQRMLTWLRRDRALTDRHFGAFQQTAGLNGQIQFFIHPNRDNKILHTALVGEMNGLLHGLTLGTTLAETWGQFGGPRAYTKWISQQPFAEPAVVRATIPADAADMPLAFPPRPLDAPTGSQFQEEVASLARDPREAAILREVSRGNVPDFLRRLVPIRVSTTDASGAEHAATYFVTPDYLAVGSNHDFCRMPMSPATALAIADRFDATLITTKLSDDIHAAAQVKLDPRPLTQDRDAVPTFFQHHQLLEEPLRGKPRGSLVAGIKKDIVWSNRLKEKPHKVAIYGWHDPDGRAIQSLFVGHVDWYVDYSHGIRLVAQHLVVDGHPRRVADVLNDPQLCTLLSREGPIDCAAVRQAAEWGK